MVEPEQDHPETEISPRTSNSGAILKKSGVILIKNRGNRPILPL
jgi:hypothetical protein